MAAMSGIQDVPPLIVPANDSEENPNNLSEIEPDPTPIPIRDTGFTEVSRKRQRPNSQPYSDDESDLFHTPTRPPFNPHVTIIGTVKNITLINPIQIARVIKRVSPELTEQDIKEALAGQDVTEVKRISKRSNDGPTPTNVLVLSFDCPSLPESVCIGYETFPATDRAQVHRSLPVPTDTNTASTQTNKRQLPPTTSILLVEKLVSFVSTVINNLHAADSDHKRIIPRPVAHLFPGGRRPVRELSATVIVPNYTGEGLSFSPILSVIDLHDIRSGHRSPVPSDNKPTFELGYLTFKDRVDGTPAGHIYAYDVNRHDDGAKELTITGDFDVTKQLHPHGISAYEDSKSGKTYFFVINHYVGYDVVDIFEFHRSSMSLSFVKSRRDPLMISVNNLVATGPDSFYITNEADTLHPTLRLAKTLLMLKTGYVLFCDVTSCRQVSEALFEPNGIDMSPDRRYLYVDQPFERRVQVYERNKADNSLKGNEAIQSIDVWTSPDNIYVDADGDLWLGCIAVGHTAMAYIDHEDVRVASQVLRVKLGGSKDAPYRDYELNEVYSEDGSNLTMSTSAVRHGNVLLIGSLHERMMRCTLDAL
ncbi:mechanosensory abnormality protein 6-like [Diadema setosum]|uniref:mechanosensory abnormality protein 6-like n=1 Tax=Diadema setosum TaxID=31175 RepID=UPI003B3B9729